MRKPTAVFALGLCFVIITQSANAQSRQLDPRVASFLKLIGYQDMTLEQLRATPIEKIKYAGPPVTPYPNDDVQRIKITKDSIPVLVFNPSHAANLPVIINYHGGGFIAPLIPALEHSLWMEAKTFGAVVFAVDYGTAPEHKYPAAVNDSYNAFKWISENANTFGGDTSRIVLIGNSAGANLAAVVTHRAKKEGLINKIKLQVLNGMPADMRPSHIETSASYRENATGYFHTKALSYFALESYAPGQHSNPEVSPILNNDLKGLPPAVIINAEFDPLRDDGISYAKALQKAGVQVWEKTFAGQIHLLLGLPPTSEPIKEYESMVKKAMDAVMIKKIDEEKFVGINGIEQWITIHGDSAKPILLFLHGGPGSTMSPYSENMFSNWEKDFLIVQWDQRGAGRTFGRNAPEELTPAFLKNNLLMLDQMTADGIVVSEYLLKRLNKHKLILFGSSWGSVLGVTMASKRPELFHAYIGHSQVTNPASDLVSYEKVFQLAEQNKDTASLQILRILGNPPYAEARNVGKLFRILKKYECMREEPAPTNWFKLAAAYDNEKDSRHREDGDDYSFVNYVGDQKMGIAAMRSSINFPLSNTEFKIPVYLIQGENDLLTRKEDTERYFNSIKAPDKKYYLLPKAAHGFNQPVLSTLYTIAISVVR